MVLDKTLESLLDCKEIHSVHPKGNQSWIFIHCKDWCWSWSSNALATWYKELTHWKRPWCWKRLEVEGERDDRGCNGQMASLTQWIWVYVSSRSWWWTGKPGMLKSLRLQRVGHDWMNELNWTSGSNTHSSIFFFSCFEGAPHCLSFWRCPPLPPSSTYPSVLYPSLSALKELKLFKFRQLVLFFFQLVCTDYYYPYFTVQGVCVSNAELK